MYCLVLYSVKHLATLVVECAMEKHCIIVFVIVIIIKGKLYVSCDRSSVYFCFFSVSFAVVLLFYENYNNYVNSEHLCSLQDSSASEHIGFPVRIIMIVYFLSLSECL